MNDIDTMPAWLAACRLKLRINRIGGTAHPTRVLAFGILAMIEDDSPPVPQIDEAQGAVTLWWRAPCRSLVVTVQKEPDRADYRLTRRSDGQTLKAGSLIGDFALIRDLIHELTD